MVQKSAREFCPSDRGVSPVAARQFCPAKPGVSSISRLSFPRRRAQLFPFHWASSFHFSVLFSLDPSHGFLNLPPRCPPDHLTQTSMVGGEWSGGKISVADFEAGMRGPRKLTLFHEPFHVPPPPTRWRLCWRGVSAVTDTRTDTLADIRTRVFLHRHAWLSLKSPDFASSALTCGGSAALSGRLRGDGRLPRR